MEVWKARGRNIEEQQSATFSMKVKEEPFSNINTNGTQKDHHSNLTMKLNNIKLRKVLYSIVFMAGKTAEKRRKDLTWIRKLSDAQIEKRLNETTRGNKRQSIRETLMVER